ncbi:MAG: ATP-binding protein [Planctomycetota bacterium]
MPFRLRNLRLENKAWFYVGLVLAGMAAATYLWITLREKTLLYVQTARIFFENTVEPMRELALQAQTTGTRTPHPLASFPRPAARYYWRVVSRDAKYTQNLPMDTFELDALDAFSNAPALETLAGVDQPFKSLAKNLEGPRDPLFLRAFLSALRQPNSDVTYRVLLTAFRSPRLQRRLRTVLSFAARSSDPAVLDAYWTRVDERLRAVTAADARTRATALFYKDAECKAVATLIEILQDRQRLSALAKLFTTFTLEEPAKAIDGLLAEMSSPPAQDALQELREDPSVGIEPLVEALEQQESRDAVQELFRPLLRSARLSDLDRLQRESADAAEKAFPDSPQARILALVRELFAAPVELPMAPLLLQSLQLSEGIDVVDALVWGLEGRETQALLAGVTRALAEPAGAEVVQAFADSLEQAMSRARRGERDEIYRILPTAPDRWNLLNATEAFQYLAPLRVTADCLVCHGQEGFRSRELRGAISISFPWKPESGAIGLGANRRVIAASLAVIILSTLLVLIKVIRALMIAPLERLKGAADRISRGDLDARADLATGDEIGEFSDAFDEMVRRLKQSQEELRALNRDLDQKLTELEQVNVQLQRANSLKSQFLSTVTHELRTPLNSIIGFSELLRDSSRAPLAEKQLRYAGNIYLSGRHLLRLINEILDLAKIESGELSVDLRPVSVQDVVTQVVGMFADIQEKLSLEVQVDSDVPGLYTDEGKLTQILYNLVGNAVKFTPDGGRITIRAAARDGRVHISVADTGVGIRKEDQSMIFERFRQVDGSATRRYGGIGLGLAIVHELVKLLGGEISVQSELGRGSTFTVSLPVLSPPA